MVARSRGTTTKTVVRNPGYGSDLSAALNNMSNNIGGTLVGSAIPMSYTTNSTATSYSAAQALSNA